MKILVVDDDPQIRDVLAVGLTFAWSDATVLPAGDGTSALHLFDAHDPDVVLLDVGLPDRTGFDVLQAIRRVADVPVLLLSARGEEVDQVRGLELGADDYIVKPFGHLALLARIRAVMRRSELPPPARALPDFEAGEVSIDFQERQVRLAGEPLPLTPIEYRLLYTLARAAGRTMPHQALVERVWGPDFPATTANLKVLVSRLRAKLERPGGPRYIETERGLGYRFVRLQPPPSRLGVGEAVADATAASAVGVQAS